MFNYSEKEAIPLAPYVLSFAPNAPSASPESEVDAANVELNGASTLGLTLNVGLSESSAEDIIKDLAGQRKHFKGIFKVHKFKKSKGPIRCMH